MRWHRLCAGSRAGNHEHWAWLDDARSNAHSSPEGFRRVTANIEWADRGTVWTWQGLRFGAIGGATTPPWPGQSRNVNWWPNLEAPTVPEILPLLDGTTALDILLTHYAPDGVHIDSPTRTPPASDSQPDPAAVPNLLGAVVAITKPDLVAHGHRYSHTTSTGPQILGLAGHDNPGTATAVLDITTPTPTVSTPRR